ncbi:DUF3810 domain-containing protein [Clostridium thermarum]|uniref:DUF3810 domain-containing protein n=1 Tax=Clostridium thermarum TaxID=1716543 RepID=UPI001120A22F|nr:DUF3810 domain-containing protein [Clostridium thermarum]
MKIDKKERNKLVIVGLVPIIMLLNSVSKSVPQLVEKLYSTGINKPIRQLLSFISSIVPFSAAEFLVFTLIAILIVMVVILIIKIIKGGFLKQLLNIAAYLSGLYVLFMLFWGFNYNRLSFDKIAGLTIEKSSKQELYELCELLIERANNLRAQVAEDSKGVMHIEGGYKDVFKRAYLGYSEAAKLYPELGGSYGRPKGVLLSVPMSYTGITGIYMPYTGEPNVNNNIRDFMLPCTTTHEMAHQRGFAREDEANYIAYVTCTSHPDADFKYSGVMLALINSMNALADVDYEGFRQLYFTYSEGIKRDLQDNREFWKKYEGKIEKISDTVNDTYLKSNGQADGVKSYGRMVDLLLAEYKSGRME